MNIDRLEVGFTTLINPGRCAYFIYCNKNGVFINPDEIFENAQAYNRIVFIGDDPLQQKEHVAKLCKRLVRINPRITFEIYTKGIIKPIEISGYVNNTIFNITIPTKDNKEYKIDSLIYCWFAELGANFIFDVFNIDDIDNTITAMNSIGLKKSQVFLRPRGDIKNLQRQTKFYGVNLAYDIDWGLDEDDETKIE